MLWYTGGATTSSGLGNCVIEQWGTPKKSFVGTHAFHTFQMLHFEQQEHKQFWEQWECSSHEFPPTLNAAYIFALIRFSQFQWTISTLSWFLPSLFLSVCRCFSSWLNETLRKRGKVLQNSLTCHLCCWSAVQHNFYTYLIQELSKITMPVIFNEPLSFLQRMVEYLEYAPLLMKAVECENPTERLEVSR